MVAKQGKPSQSLIHELLEKAAKQSCVTVVLVYLVYLVSLVGGSGLADKTNQIDEIDQTHQPRLASGKALIFLTCGPSGRSCVTVRRRSVPTNPRFVHKTCDHSVGLRRERPLC